MSWTAFAAIFVAFFLTHSIPVRPPVKARVTALVGTRGFGIGYSILSLAMLSLLIWAAGEAPYVQLWPQYPWQRHAVHLGMLAVCLLLALSIARPNPFSFGGRRNDRFDPDHPGIVRWHRHPILLGLGLWAGLHLIPNGDLAHVILFGVLGGFALAGQRLIDRRKRRELGQERWHALDSARRAAPMFHKPASVRDVSFRIGAGVLAFVLLIWAHPYVIGVSALS